MEPYRSLDNYASVRLPHTEALCRRVISFPNGTSIGGGDIERVSELTALILAHLPEVHARLDRIVQAI
jgi:dTDP-4-amino-4,6-dideoxygalactose transaminase